MPPLTSTDNPIMIAASIIAWVIALPLAALVIRGIFFFGWTSKRFDDLVTSVANIEQRLEMVDGEASANAWSFAAVEEDINELQRKAGIEVRLYPDRRVGPPDRRRHA